jgi:hypothetical protein
VSVARAREFMLRARAAGIIVHELAGWESRGNGQTSAYEGWVNHHTATSFGMAPRVLWEGRSDLAGPLCNTSGNVDGSITLIAAHPANHAGASGGWNTSPLPRTSIFNKRVWGHEIVYPGTVAMTAPQYRTALIVSKIGVDIWGYGDVNRIKFHQGTSITGKWDPGWASGRTYDVARFRADIPGAFAPPAPPVEPFDREEEEMAKSFLPASKDGTRASFGRPYPSKDVWLYMSTGWEGHIQGHLYAWEAGHVLRSDEAPDSQNGAWPIDILADRPAAIKIPAGVVQLSFDYTCSEDISLTWGIA